MVLYPIARLFFQQTDSVMPHGVLRLSCAERCLQFDWQGYRR